MNKIITGICLALLIVVGGGCATPPKTPKGKLKFKIKVDKVKNQRLLAVSPISLALFFLYSSSAF